ncbi:hypothetical protein BC833DRAFT_648903 [Globomyces pollinis-pini]|nr:hypothetical protein BC833DRAFT_648903 [Globomyces pollinis-pini]
MQFPHAFLPGDAKLLRHVRIPALGLLVGAVGFGLGIGGFYIGHILANDPTMVYSNREKNPFPYLNVPQNRNLKLFAVRQKFEDTSVKDTYFENYASKH